MGPASGDGEYAWVNSGDRAYLADGEIYVTGRVKDIIIKGGRNLYPHEVEELAGARGRNSQGLHRGVRAEGRSDGNGEVDRGGGIARARGIAARGDRGGGDGTGLARAGVAAGPSRTDTAGQYSKNFERKIASRRNQATVSRGKIVRGQSAGLGADRAACCRRRDATRRAEKYGPACGEAWKYCTASIFAPCSFLWIVPTWTIVNFISDYRKAGRFTSAALKVLFALIGCRVRVIGKEYVDTPGAKVYASNHTSYFDVLALMLGLGVPYHFVAKMEVGGMPFIGTFLRKMGHTKFDRSDPQSRLRQSEEMEKLLREGESIFVFPEGTFTSEDGVRPFQLGAFKAAVDAGVPIVPVSLAGTRRFLRDGTYLPRPTSVTITVSPPIYPRAASEAARPEESSAWHELIRLRDTTRETIARHSGEPLL